MTLAADGLLSNHSIQLDSQMSPNIAGISPGNILTNIKKIVVIQIFNFVYSKPKLNLYHEHNIPLLCPSLVETATHLLPGLMAENAD